MIFINRKKKDYYAWSIENKTSLAATYGQPFYSIESYLSNIVNQPN